jgi:hypothetical protein
MIHDVLNMEMLRAGCGDQPPFTGWLGGVHTLSLGSEVFGNPKLEECV